MKLQAETCDYARALRAIGQDLANLVLNSLEVEAAGSEFIVRGQQRGAQPRQSAKESPSVWRKLQSKIAQSEPQQPAPLLSTFERRYTAEDVNRLDETGIARRRGPAKPPEISGLAEKLRTIGRIVDAKKGRLAKLTDDSNHVTIEYRDENDLCHSETYSMLELYKIQQSYYGKRGTWEAPDVWRGVDR